MRNKITWATVICLIVFMLVLPACSPPDTNTQIPTTSTPTVANQPTTSSAPVVTTAAPAKPQGELVAALSSFGNENFLPWLTDTNATEICNIIYEGLIYYDPINLKFIPGLAESWDVSTDAKSLTYHIRKGVQFQDGWGEFTAEDVKYTFEKHAGPDSIGLTSQTRQIDSMEIPDPYTLILHFRAPYPTYYAEISYGNGGVYYGTVCKKYVETVGETIAAQKPIGTSPYKMIDSQVATFYKFEAAETHWRVVPEFKNLTVRSVPEISTVVAMLKTREIDLALVPSEQLADLKAAGLGTEVSKVGGSYLQTSWGGLVLPVDYRYNAEIHNKDPWVDVRVRKAMTISIDREAICKSIFAGGATPISVPLFAANVDKYKYPYDPAAAKHLLIDAGYPDGFSFKLTSFNYPGIPEVPRVMEALDGYWKQIGLHPELNFVDRFVHNARRTKAQNVGEIGPQGNAPGADMINKASLFLMPNGQAALFQDEGSYAIWKEGNAKIDMSERMAYVDKLNQYYFENYGPIPLVQVKYCYGYNADKVSPWPHQTSASPYYLEYVRHAEPLNTFRLFTIWPDR